MSAGCRRLHSWARRGKESCDCSSDKSALWCLWCVEQGSCPMPLKLHSCSLERHVHTDVSGQEAMRDGVSPVARSDLAVSSFGTSDSRANLRAS